jgi:hypothetical protein
MLPVCADCLSSTECSDSLVCSGTTPEDLLFTIPSNIQKIAEGKLKYTELDLYKCAPGG